MQVPYSYLEDIALADIAFVATGKNLEELFISASDATMNVMIENLNGIEMHFTRRIQLDSESIEMLLFNFLQEFIYYKDAEQLLLRVSSLKVENVNDRYLLYADTCGEKVNPSRHKLIVDVKAVTFHRFRVEHSGAEWRATVILDV
jgi:SHS2 domain-containing protein